MFTLVLNCIKQISEFNGKDVDQLPDFFTQVENILPSVEAFDANNKKVLFDYIKNKCVGDTRKVLHRHTSTRNWAELREILKNNFGEKENTNNLMDKLKMLKVYGTIENYHYNVTQLINRLHNRNLTHNDGIYTTDEINRIALKIFKENLPEPTKTMIYGRNPETLEATYKIIVDTRQQHYTAYGPTGKNYSFRQNFSDNVRNNYNFNQNQDAKNRIKSNEIRNYNSYKNNNKKFNRPQSYGQDRDETNSYNRRSYNTGNTGNYSGNYYQNYNRQYNERSDQNRTHSGQTRQTNRSRFDNPEPMDIGNTQINFCETGVNSFPI